MASDTCPECGHAWDLHPGTSLWLIACGECIYEEDHDLRDEAAMCSRVQPAEEHRPAGQTLVTRYKRRPLRGDRVVVQDRTGSRWLLRPPGATRESVEGLLAQVREDLAAMPIAQFREKYSALRT